MQSSAIERKFAACKIRKSVSERQLFLRGMAGNLLASSRTRMRSPFVVKSRSLCGLIALIMGVAVASPPLRAQSGPVSDDFDSTSLNTGLWTVVNPVGNGTVSLNGTDAVLSLPAGTAHDP